MRKKFIYDLKRFGRKEFRSKLIMENVKRRHDHNQVFGFFAIASLELVSVAFGLQIFRCYKLRSFEGNTYYLPLCSTIVPACLIYFVMHY